VTFYICVPFQARCLRFYLFLNSGCDIQKWNEMEEERYMSPLCPVFVAVEFYCIALSISKMSVTECAGLRGIGRSISLEESEDCCDGLIPPGCSVKLWEPG
jgi:hypothetical protein